MKILFTGEPHVGKSTLLNNLVYDIANKHGFVTNEVIKDGKRFGFELLSSMGNRALLASTDSNSVVRVSRYGVNVDEFNQFISELSEPTDDALLYIDEIGQMELFSERFQLLVEGYLGRPNIFLGTLTSVYHDEFTDKLRARNDIEIVQLSFENRDVVKAEIQARITQIINHGV